MVSELYHNAKGLYNITSINNLVSIFTVGILSKNMLSSSVQYVEISNANVQLRRDGVSFWDETQLQDYANLYFNPRNAMMYSIKHRINDICVLKIDKSVLNLENIIIADRNASVSGVCFFPPNQAIRELNFDIINLSSWNFDDPIKKMRIKALMMAEVLVYECIQPCYITEVLVGNRIAYDKVLSLNLPVPVKIDRRIFFNE